MTLKAQQFQHSLWYKPYWQFAAVAFVASLLDLVVCLPDIYGV